jgi:hypothetical protein
MQFIILENLMLIGRSTEMTNIDEHLIWKLTRLKYAKYNNFDGIQFDEHGIKIQKRAL